jgi:hypothetical protein
LSQRRWYAVEYAVGTVERNGLQALAEWIDGNALVDGPHGAMTSHDTYPCEPT